MYTQNCLLRRLLQTKNKICLGCNLHSCVADTETLTEENEHFPYAPNCHLSLSNSEM